mmetsp:Transcript_14832/g.37018  ORF Transcript_14832/g.37018 Transcript_14832/m.37018 type:complete len:266 (-) Transcript_14832:1618-2415(-)
MLVVPTQNLHLKHTVKQAMAASAASMRATRSLATSSPATSRVPKHRSIRLAPPAALQTAGREPRFGPSQTSLANIAATAGVVLANAATLLPGKMQVLNLVVHSLGVGALAVQVQELAKQRDGKKAANAAASVAQAPAASEAQAEAQVTMQLQAALAEATRIAETRTKEAESLACMNRALVHVNAQQATDLRAARQHVTALNLRIQKLKANPAAFDVASDPAVEHSAHEVVSQQVVQELEGQLSRARWELIEARAALEACKLGQKV